jgi:hypothetical protein
MFTEKIYIRKNTPFLRKKLKQLGHTLCVCTEFADAKILTVTNQPDAYRSVHGWGYVDAEYPSLTQEKVLEEFYKTTINYDCGENEDLFLALAARRDDTDFMQLFILLEDYGAGDYGFLPKGSLLLCKAEKIHQYFPIGMKLRKATREEIIDFYNENDNPELYLKSDFLDLETKKQLIINDLLPRIPYQTKCHVDIQGLIDSNLEYKEIFEKASKVQDNLFNKLNDKVYTLYSYFGDGAFYFLGFESMDDYGIDATLIKPYLIPLDEMTEKQKEEYCALQQKVIYNSKGPVSEDINNLMIFIYRNHLDFNDLIPKGLALNANKYNVYK